MDNGAIELLCQLTYKRDSSLTLNGVWGLMNMAFQSDQRIKVQIITALGMFSNKMSMVTKFGHKQKSKNFINKFDISGSNLKLNC